MTTADRYSVTEEEIRFDPTAEERLYQRLFDFWHPVAYSSQLGDAKPLAATLLDEAIVVVRLDGEVRAFATCASIGVRPCHSVGWRTNRSAVRTTGGSTDLTACAPRYLPASEPAFPSGPG